MKDLEGFLADLRAEGAAEIERITAAARSRAREILAEAEDEREAERAHMLDAARKAARQETTLAVAERAAAASRELLSLRRQRIEAVLDRASELLEGAAPDAAGTRRLLLAAVDHVPPGPVRIQCRPEAVAAVREALQPTDLQPLLEPIPDLPGIVASTPDGHVVVEATLPALLAGRRAELAIALARRIEGDGG